MTRNVIHKNYWESLVFSNGHISQVFPPHIWYRIDELARELFIIRDMRHHENTLEYASESWERHKMNQTMDYEAYMVKAIDAMVAYQKLRPKWRWRWLNNLFNPGIAKH